MSINSKHNIFGLSLTSLEQLLVDSGEKAFRGRQVFEWMYQKRLRDFAGMTNLNRPLRDRLTETFEIVSPEVVRKQTDPADGTRKFLVKLSDGALVEMVLIPVGERLALCLSSQVGCPVGCAFCATGLMGFDRNLTAAEMLGELMLGQDFAGEKGVSTVVIMGMGEPLLNLENVVEMITTASSEKGLGFGARRFTISTVGIVKQIKRLTEMQLKAGLALSLHAPIQELRERLVPLARANPLDKLIDACREYAEQMGDHITLEYVMIEKITDTMECAEALATLTRKLPCKINLIPYNPIINVSGTLPAPRKKSKRGRPAGLREGKTSRKSRGPQPFSPTDFRTPSSDRINRFRNYLYPRCSAITLRKPKGLNIAAACGQLAGQAVKN